MMPLRLAVVLVALAPSLALAQRGGMGGSKKADWNSVETAAPRGPTISAKDLEKISPLRLFVDKKKSLKLTDEQLATLKDADAKLITDNATRLQLVDSLKKELRGKSGTLSAEDEAKMVLGREALMTTVSEIRASYEAAAKAAMAGFDDAQKKTAEELLTKEEEDNREMLRDKLGGGGGMGGGMGGRRGRGGL